MTDEQIIDFLSENMDYFVTNDLVLTFFRTIGWRIVKGLNTVLNFCGFLYDKTFGLIDITSWTAVNDFIKEYDLLIKAVMVLSLVILGYIYIIGKNKQSDLLVSLVILVTVITSSNYLFSTFNSFATMFKDAVVGEEGGVDGYALVNQNLYDLIYIDEQIGLDQMGESAELPQYPELTKKDVDMINVTEILKDDEDGLTDNAKDILGKKLAYRQSGSKLEDIYNGVLWTDYMNEYYYRYQFNYGTYYLAAIAAIIVFLGLAYKNVRIVWELLTSRILAALFSADLSSKKKIAKILEGIRDGYYALCFTAITLRVYFLVTDYVADQIRDSGFARGIIILFVAFCAIDGANIMERITGVDAGLSSMTAKLLAATQLVQGAAMAAQHMRQMLYMKRQAKALEGMRDAMGGGNNTGQTGTGPGTNDAGQTGTGTGTDESTDPGAAPGAADPSDNRTCGTEADTHHTDVGADDSDNSREPMQENPGTGTDSNLNGGTDNNFQRMDDEISGKADVGQSDQSNADTKYSGNGNQEGMFDKWAEKRWTVDNQDSKNGEEK